MKNFRVNIVELSKLVWKKTNKNSPGKIRRFLNCLSVRKILNKVRNKILKKTRDTILNKR